MPRRRYIRHFAGATVFAERSHIERLIENTSHMMLLLPPYGRRLPPRCRAFDARFFGHYADYATFRYAFAMLTPFSALSMLLICYERFVFRCCRQRALRFFFSPRRPL